MIGRLPIFVTGLLIGLAMTLAWPSPARASKCEAGTVFNPITKVRWTCIFPITVGGIRVGSFDKLCHRNKSPLTVFTDRCDQVIYFLTGYFYIIDSHRSALRRGFCSYFNIRSPLVSWTGEVFHFTI